MTKDIDKVVIPKFCAVCVDDEDTVYFKGTGDTPDECFNEFMSNGDFEDQCAYWLCTPGEPVSVYIYSVIDVEHSDWLEDERDSNWIWCLDDKVDTRIALCV